ncbi:MAG TPA: DUF4382 domain-containing protein [Gemmatimonadales bacterium]|nr:DUF4382 domain-containing protein [Gemmatimonadales bacterium]
MTRPSADSRTLQANVPVAAPIVPVVPATCGGFDAAGVTIAEIYLQGQGGRTVLRSTPATVDLCDLANETLGLVNEAPVPAGTYTELRLVITGGFVQVGGQVFATSGYTLPQGVPAATGTLQMPSYGSSGLKVDFAGGPVTIGTDQKVYALDFDVAESFGKDAGASGQWVMNPIIKSADISFTGSVEVDLKLGQGVTLPTISGTQVTFADFSASASDGTTSATQSFDATTGATVFYLPPSGTAYTITLNVPNTLDVTVDPATPPTATITEGTASPAVSFTLTAVAAKP